MNTIAKYSLGGLILGFILGAIVSPAYLNSDRSGMSRMSGISIDRHFIEQMIPHHEGAILMAELALKKTDTPEIVSLANDIIVSQKKEIDDMKTWYKDWFGTDVSDNTNQHMMGGHMMGGAMHMDSMAGDLIKLENAQNFDLEFLKQMIPHHEMAVMMASMMGSTTERKEMKILAENIITSQSREIKMMRDWLDSWGNL